ncbi:MAG: DUF3455 domain-containing protein [Methylosarcina sp.]
MNNKIFLFLMLLPCVVVAETAIPEQIQPPSGHSSILSVHAKGDQIYQCTPNNGGYAWTLKAPDAKLFDDRGNIVGNHYAGPVWEYKEGSRVVGRVLKKLDVAPASSIPWLLVEVTSHQGQGFLSNVSFINRIHTHGGLAPKSGCDANHPGAEKRIAYTADYVFYAKEL